MTPIGNIGLVQHISISLQRVLIAFCLASVIGVGLGVMMGWNEDVQAIVEPIFELLRPSPPLRGFRWSFCGWVSKNPRRYLLCLLALSFRWC